MREFYCVVNTFARFVVSRHKTLEAAQKAASKLRDAGKAQGGYIPTKITKGLFSVGFYFENCDTLPNAEWEGFEE